MDYLIQTKGSGARGSFKLASKPGSSTLPSDSHSSKNVAELIDQSMNGPLQTRCLCNVTKRKKKNLHGHYNASKEGSKN